MLSATRGTVDDEPEIGGNFLVDGEHWRYLSRAVAHRAERVRLPLDRDLGDAALLLLPATEVVLVKAPEGTQPELEKAVLEASSRLRLERQIAFDRPAVLTTHGLRIRFLPVDMRKGYFFAPFDVRDGDQQTQGLIALAGDRDPVPVLLERAEDGLVMSAWVAALLGYAALTSPSKVSGVRRYAATSPRPSRRPGATGPRWVRGQSRPSLFSQELTVVEGHRGAVHFVAGHRRRLFDGREPSDEAIARAAEYGIRLHPDETWVRPHARGLSDGKEVTFRWAPSVAVAEWTAQSPR